MLTNQLLLFIMNRGLHMNDQNIEIPEKYIPMNDFACNWYFCKGDIKVADKDIKKILPLTKDYSSALWERYISRKNRHTMLLDENDKKLILQKVNYNWQHDWN